MTITFAIYLCCICIDSLYLKWGCSHPLSEGGRDSACRLAQKTSIHRLHCPCVSRYSISSRNHGNFACQRWKCSRVFSPFWTVSDSWYVFAIEQRTTAIHQSITDSGRRVPSSPDSAAPNKNTCSAKQSRKYTAPLYVKQGRWWHTRMQWPPNTLAIIIQSKSILNIGVKVHLYCIHWSVAPLVRLAHQTTNEVALAFESYMQL